MQNPSNERLHFAGFLLVKVRPGLIECLFHRSLLQHKRFLPWSNSSKPTIEELSLRRKIERRVLPILEELVGEGADPSSETEKMIITLKLGPRETEEWLSGNELEDKAAETPHINSIVNSSGKNQLRWAKTDWSNGFCWRVGKEIRYPRSVISI